MPIAEPVLFPPGVHITPELQQALLELSRLAPQPANLPQVVAAAERALRLVDRGNLPHLWAVLQVQLGQALSQNPFGDRADNLERAIAAFQAALQVFRRDEFPGLWADVKNDLGLTLVYRTRGDREQNLQQAIGHLHDALTVRTRPQFPEQWADSQDNLGIAYWHYTMDGYADHLEQAIEHLELALQVRTRWQYPDKWGDTHNNLGGIWLRRLRGDRAESLERAIEHLELALQVRTRQATPAKWAMTVTNLAVAYAERLRGNRADNLEQAIDLAGQALEVHPRQAGPEQWATIHNTLGTSYAARIAGNRAENLELAIDHLQQALQVYTRQTYPELWSTVQNNLANAYRQRLRGDRAENLEQAIDHFQQALQVRSRQALPEQWAETVHDLATTYFLRLEGDRAENLEQSIELYHQALALYPRQDWPEQWGLIQANLGCAFQERIRGDPLDNLLKAIDHHQQALEVLTREAFPRRWAAVQNNLANTLTGLPAGERGEAVEQAIDHLHAALHVRTREALPEPWAETQNNLGRAYLDRTQGERDENLERALQHLSQALEVWTRETYPENWAGAILNLAVAWQDRASGERTANETEAIRLYEQAAEVFTRSHYPLRWAGIRRHLATIYARRSRQEPGGDALEQAIACYREALEVYTPPALPQHCRDTAYELGCLLHDGGDLAAARPVLELGHQAVEALRGEVQREAAKRSLSAENSDLYARLVTCCLGTGDVPAAFEYATAAKGRAFVDVLASIRLDLSRAGDDNPELAADLGRVQALRRQIDALLALLGGEGGQTRLFSPAGEGLSRESPRGELYQQLLAVQAQQQRQWDLLAIKYPALTATQQSRSITAREAQQMAAEIGATLVEYYDHAGGWCAFVVRPEGVTHVPLPGLDDSVLARLRRWARAVELPAGRGQLSYKPLVELYRVAVAPLELDRPAGSSVVLAPFGSLHLLPLAAAREPASGRYLAEDHTLAFVPSLSALQVGRQQRQSRPAPSAAAGFPSRLLAVAYPGEPHSPYHLPHVLAEAEAVVRHFSRAESLAGNRATVDAVLSHAPLQDVVHLGCHGWFDESYPAQSGLMLAGGWLTVQRIIAELHLQRAWLVTMAACLSGQAEIRQGEEYVGLTQALLTAGAQTVVSSLWAVDDAATQALFAAFYPAVAGGEAPATALQQAGAAVRGRPQWQHPYYWAAFQASGLALGAWPRPPSPPAGAPDGDEALPLAWDLRTLYLMSQQWAPPPAEPAGPGISRGGQTMDQEQMVTNLTVLLDQMRDNPAEIQAALDPAEQAGLVAALGRLAEDANAVQDQVGMLAWVADIYAAIEAVPGLHGLLFEESGEPLAAQVQRSISVADWAASAERNLYAQQRAAQVRNAVLDCCQQLQQSLGPGTKGGQDPSSAPPRHG